MVKDILHLFVKLNSALFTFSKNSDSVLSFRPLFKHKCTLRQLEFQQLQRILCQQGKIGGHGFQLMPFFWLMVNCFQLSLSRRNKFKLWAIVQAACVGEPRTQTRSVAVEMVRLRFILVEDYIDLQKEWT